MEHSRKSEAATTDASPAKRNAAAAATTIAQGRGCESVEPAVRERRSMRYPYRTGYVFRSCYFVHFECEGGGGRGRAGWGTGSVGTRGQGLSLACRFWHEMYQ